MVAVYTRHLFMADLLLQNFMEIVSMQQFKEWPDYFVSSVANAWCDCICHNLTQLRSVKVYIFSEIINKYSYYIKFSLAVAGGCSYLELHLIC